MPVGLNLGAAIHPSRETGFLFGAEASVVHLDDGVWMGGFADVLRDFGTEATRLSIGPEAGYGLFGADLGFLLQLDDDGSTFGLHLRGLITIGFASLYGRWVHLVGTTREADFGEVGVLVKLPLQM